MAFKGDLRNISLFDVLQTLQQNQQTGVLVVQRAGVVRKIHISPAGIFFTRSYRPMRLGEIFVRRGLVTPQDVELLLLQQRDDPRPIGELMVASGKVSQEEVDEILRYHAEDEIFEIFRWDHGSFAFYDDETITDQPSKGFSEVRLDPSGLGLEMARRLDEMERLREVIPTNDEFYIQIEGYEPDRQQNGPQVLAAFDALTEPNSVDDLRDLVGLSLFDSLGVVAQLIEGGLIRPLDQDELMDASWQVRRKGDLRRAAAMLEKAHRIDPSNREVLEKCIDAVERLGDPRRLAVHLATLGNLSIGCGESEEAIELLEQAHHQDPENFAVLFALRDAFAQLGDSERCADISLKLVRAYSEDGNLAQAIEACQTGLELSPESVPLRFYLGQTLFQANRGDEAREEILTLIQETRSSAKAMKSEKAHDLLTRCYRLLLKLNPRDREAHDGLHDLARRRLNAMRRRKLAVWGSIAGSILLVVVVIGVTIAGSGAASLMERIHKAQQRNDETTVMELVGQLVERHPESDEAVQARAIRSEINKRRSDALTAKRKRETTIKSGFDAELSEIRTALRERSPLEALTLIPPFFDRLGRPEASFLRKGMRAHVDAEFTAFVDKMKEDFNVDRRHVSLHEQALRPEADPGLDELRDIEKSLAGMRAKSWTKLHDELAMPLATIAESAHAGKMREVIESLIATLESATGTFSTIDDLYYTARRMRLHAEIKQAVSLARQRGREHLRLCEFAAARKYFDDAHKLADAVADEEPREHFLELLNWLEKTNTRSDMARRRDEVDLVVKRLEQIEKLIAADRPAAAFRLFRPLISEHRLIQFERKYELPFRVNSTPRGAEVFVNEKRVGVTPATIKLGILGSTEVRVRRKGFTEAEAKLLPFDPALDGETNLVLVKKSAWEREVNGRVEARPVVAGKLLLIATSNANLLALHLDTGAVAWEAKTGLLDRITAAPVVAGDHAYIITVGGMLHRLRLADGKRDGPGLQLPGQVRHDAVFVDGTLYLATANRKLVAVRSNRILYYKPLARGPATPLLHSQGLLFLGTAEGEILVHDAATGKERTRRKTPSGSSFFGGIAVHGGLVVAGAEDGALYAFRIETGEPAWKYRTSGPITAAPVSEGELLFLPARDGYIHALDASGKLQLRYELAGAAVASPTVSDSFLYAIDGRRITAFDTTEELPWWDYDFSPAVGAPEQVVAGEGVVVAVTSASRVIAFPKDSR